MVTKILPIGDSLVWGVSNNNTKNEALGGYRTVLLNTLITNGFSDIDFVGTADETDPRNRRSGPNGIDNDHEGRRGQRIDQLTTVLTDNGNALLNTLAPDIALLMAGTNDLLQDDSATVAMERLNALITALTSAGTHVLVATLPPFVSDGNNDISRLDASDEAERVAFNAALKATAFDPTQVTVVDLDTLLTPTDISSDGVHLTSLGYSKVATAWHNALIPLLDPTTDPTTIDPATVYRNTPQRIEAEAFNELGTFTIQQGTDDGLPDDITVIRLIDSSGAGTATTTFNLESGYYDIAVGYFDENDAIAQINLTIGDTVLDPVALNQDLGAADASPENYVYQTIGTRVPLTQGSQLSLTGTPGVGGNDELVWLDFIEFIPVPAPAESESIEPAPAEIVGLDIIGDAQNNIFEGTPNNDVFDGQGGKDRANGREGDDDLQGSKGNDRLFGDDGSDRLNGGPGNDRLTGGTGDDELIGGKGIDIMKGGADADAFIYTSRKDGGKRGDRIQDFSSSDDLFMLEGKQFDQNFKVDQSLKRKFFTIGNEATRKNHRLLYNEESGLLAFDPDGNGSKPSFPLARLTKGLDITHKSFRVI